MTYHIIALVIISFFICLAYFCRASLYSPLVINCFSWFVVFVSGLFFYDKFYPLQTNVFVAWLIWFLVNSSIFYILNPSIDTDVFRNREIRVVPINYTWCIVLLIVWLIYRIWVIGSTGPSQFFLNLRLSSNGIDEYEALGLVGKFYPLVFAFFIFENLYSQENNKFPRVVLWLWMLLYAVATMGKFAILTPVFVWLVINGLQGKVKSSQLLKTITVLFFVMLLIHVVRSGEESEFNLGEMLSIYIYSPIIALGYYNIDSSMPYGSYVFRFIYAVGNYFGMATKPADVIMPYVNVPWETNVYTVLFPFYHDFGYSGVFLFSAFFGLFFAIIFLLYARFSNLYLMLFSAFVTLIFSQFIVEGFFSVFSMNLQIFLYVLFVYLISVKRNENGS